LLLFSNMWLDFEQRQLPPEPDRYCCLKRHCVLTCHTANSADGAKAKSVVIKTWGYEKILVTDTLAMSPDGSMLSPRVILNHKTMAKEQLPREITVRCQLKRLSTQWKYGWMVVSGVEEMAKGTPEETWDAGLGCI
jgi:hypothetical protein